MTLRRKKTDSDSGSTMTLLERRCILSNGKLQQDMLYFDLQSAVTGAERVGASDDDFWSLDGLVNVASWSIENITLCLCYLRSCRGSAGTMRR